MENILITGSSGFVGSHIADYILALPEPYLVHGLIRSSAQKLEHLKGNPRLFLHRIEMTDREELGRLVKELRPTRIFHLAAQSYVGPALADPVGTITNNAAVTINLFEAVRAAGLVETARILNAGSADQYGNIRPEELPIAENTPFRPVNPYAVSKITQEMLGFQYFKAFGLSIVNTRAFNQLGPRQSENAVTATFACQVARAEAGKTGPVIKIGNLEAHRDYTDVRDIVRAYWLALDKAGKNAGEVYNLCSGRCFKIGEVVNLLLEMSERPLSLEFDPSRARPSDVPKVYGDNSKFKAATGWEPEIPLEQSIRDVLDYWREQVRKELVSSSSGN